MRLILEEQLKYLQSFINNATYHPMKPDADVTYQTVNLFSSNKFFICFISDCPHYIQWNLIIYKWKVQTYHCPTCIKYIYLYQNCTNSVVRILKFCTTLVKIDVLATYGAMICSYFGIIFFLLFKKIENAVNRSFK